MPKWLGKIAGSGSGGNGLGRAGALFNDASTMTVENCTIQGNLAQGGANINSSGQIIGMAAGGGIFNSDNGVLVQIGLASTISASTPSYCQRNIPGVMYCNPGS